MKGVPAGTPFYRFSQNRADTKADPLGELLA